ncbi:hypothetical protein [Parabacteroides pacaensis]|uniref:hypothetical protein n=1 Tax=Parabacteroides pacaensis TaxID=2086575 RepID=UPI000D106219|nr:hypothetical protein [Parabacteroides pacaensis]
MKLIAETGSTKTEWALVEGNHLIQHAYTEGINPYFQNRREISRNIRLSLPESFFKKKLEQVYFYGAGCSSAEKKDMLSASLVAQFKAPIQVESDLLAAARGLFKHEAGIACILGTGSNSCLYDGEVIVKNIRPAGYILGDEGSSSALGKIFLSDLLKDLAPEELMNNFYEKFSVTANDIMESVYNKPFPNRFLATAAGFLSDYLDNEYVYKLFLQNFRNFFTRNICQYDYKNYPIRFVGAIAYKYSHILQNVAYEFGIKPDLIEKSPISGLIEYHFLTNPSSGQLY